MYKKIILLIIPFMLLADKPLIEKRILQNETNATINGMPSNLKYFKFYNSLPDEIVLKIFDKRDLSNFKGKHIFVGYGVVDPKGNNCRVFPSYLTGLDHNITICLPWWRVEREYKYNPQEAAKDNCFIPTPKPPIRVSVCKKWESSMRGAGGKVVCTSYFSRTQDPDCWDNPFQRKCFVDNCSPYVKKYCKLVGEWMGEKYNLTTAYQNEIYKEILPTETKLKVVSYQYECPYGSFTPYSKCLEREDVLMYPYTCKPDNPKTPQDDGVYVYCDEDKPQYDKNGNIIGFLGKCPDGRNIICKVNNFAETKSICIKPIRGTITKTTFKKVDDTRSYKDVEVDVLSGEVDKYASNPNCIRLNTVAESRQKAYARIVGSGYLDDDIFVIKHKPNGLFVKVYCNTQHAERVHNRVNYDGETLQCIDNNGNYKFDSTIEIDPNDIVSIQQATEDVNNYGQAYFPTGRTNYRSTAVRIDGVLVAPQTYVDNYPYYPRNFKVYLNTWENTLGTLSLLFPYAGVYKLYFFDRNGNLLATKVISIEDFEKIGKYNYMQLHMALNIPLSPKFKNVTNKDALCLYDDWVEIGGGVHGGRGSKDGKKCYQPDDNYVKEHAITEVVVKDLLTGATIDIPLVYPLPYPNRIYIAKLKLYEKRKYRCYLDFPNLHY